MVAMTAGRCSWSCPTAPGRLPRPGCRASWGRPCLRTRQPWPWRASRHVASAAAALRGQWRSSWKSKPRCHCWRSRDRRLRARFGAFRGGSSWSSWASAVPRGSCAAALSATVPWAGSRPALQAPRNLPQEISPSSSAHPAPRCAPAKRPRALPYAAWGKARPWRSWRARARSGRGRSCASGVWPAVRALRAGCNSATPWALRSRSPGPSCSAAARLWPSRTSRTSGPVAWCAAWMPARFSSLCPSRRCGLQKAARGGASEPAATGLKGGSPPRGPKASFTSALHHGITSSCSPRSCMRPSAPRAPRCESSCQVRPLQPSRSPRRSQATQGLRATGSGP
mmetsp:Transcript_53108/g.170130  ORF Transcript_53108/g.170130 Transcript_53108/m.170130 type:complete len:339 (-) Transcript_53108:408-1424(-)